MTQSIEFIYNVIRGSGEWLLSWSFRGVPFLYWMIGLVVVGTLMRFIFG